MAEQVVQMTAHCPKNIVQFKSTIYVLMMHQVDLIPITMLFCDINSKSNKMNCELKDTYDTPALWQTGSRNRRVKKRFPRYGVPIWSLWPNIRFLPSIVAEKNVTKNEHICSMCIKINKIGKQEVGIWWVQKRYPQYGIPIWSLWRKIRFLPSTVTEKNVTKNILDGWKDRQKDGQTDRGKTVYPPPPLGSGGIISKS